jgi:hypothetical protein
MTTRQLSILTGVSYLVIFFAAIFANFFVLEALQQEPLDTLEQHSGMVRAGILAFLVTVLFDVMVAWTLFVLFRDHVLSIPSTLFRMMHASIMGVAVFSLVVALSSTSAEEVLRHVYVFNTIWLIGLFFFGMHLVLLSRIFQVPRWISLFLLLAGIMYMVDTAAHFLMPDYESYASVFLALVAIPSMVGEMSLAIWMLLRGGRS